MRAEVAERCGHRCQGKDCGKTADEATLDIDHIKPLWLGGTDDPQNLQLLCDDCHLIKSVSETSARAKTERLRLEQALHKTAVEKKTRRPNARERKRAAMERRRRESTTIISERAE